MKQKFFYQKRTLDETELKLLRFSLTPEPNSPFIEIGHMWFQVSHNEVIDESFLQRSNDLPFCWKRGLVPKIAKHTDAHCIFKS